ncbi:hypothetical protein, partial [Cryobacterium sp. MLB-32]|uniref:hypothetical protein n=1 Tax=Cryobacterium sp. MLB-32 TaxID=1529318 RepID=UPI001E2C6190
MAGFLIPNGARQQHVESWTADVIGAEELGMKPRTVLQGVVRLAITMGMRDRMMLQNHGKAATVSLALFTLLAVSLVPPAVIPVLMVVTAKLFLKYRNK